MTSVCRRACVLAAVLSTSLLRAQTTEVKGTIAFQIEGGSVRKSHPEAVVWLTPTDRNLAAQLAPAAKRERLVQKDKSFHPHLLVIPTGSAVEFPNRDPFFHNVFSLFEGKRFDLGMYEAGSSRTVNFDRPGISYIFCNIHPEMSAVVIAVSTPFWATSDKSGEFTIPGMPPGEYRLDVWAEGASPETLARLSRVLTVPDHALRLDAIKIPVATTIAHKNKYGRDYDRAAKAPYEHP
jgi:plastocyanin